MILSFLQSQLELSFASIRSLKEVISSSPGGPRSSVPRLLGLVTLYAFGISCEALCNLRDIRASRTLGGLGGTVGTKIRGRNLSTYAGGLGEKACSNRRGDRRGGGVAEESFFGWALVGGNEQSRDLPDSAGKSSGCSLGEPTPARSHLYALEDLHSGGKDAGDGTSKRFVSERNRSVASIGFGAKRIVLETMGSSMSERACHGTEVVSLVFSVLLEGWWTGGYSVPDQGRVGILGLLQFHAWACHVGGSEVGGAEDDDRGELGLGGGMDGPHWTDLLLDVFDRGALKNSLHTAGSVYGSTIFGRDHGIFDTFGHSWALRDTDPSRRRRSSRGTSDFGVVSGCASSFDGKFDDEAGSLGGAAVSTSYLEGCGELGHRCSLGSATRAAESKLGSDAKAS